MSDLDRIIADGEEILDHADTTPFTPVVLLEMVLDLAREVQKHEHTFHKHAAGQAAQKSGKRVRAGAESEGHSGHAG